MTVSSTTSKSGPYNGNGVTVNFAVSFKYTSTGDVDVIVTSAAGVETTKTITTHYTITAPGDTGTVTFLVAPASGETVTIVRTMAMTQDMDLTAGGGLSANTVESNADTQLMQIQEIAERVSRAPKLRQSTSSTTPTFPEPSASAIIAWNAGATDLENKAVASIGSSTFPVSSTDNAIARWDGISGSSLQNSGVTIDDSGNIAFLTGTSISWASGDVNITHSANALAFAGATNGYSFDDDLLLPSGGAISWNSGQITLTQSAAALFLSGASATLHIRGTGNSGLELGRIDGTGSTPFIDFHSGATAVDYDTRLVAGGGSGSNGGGSLELIGSYLITPNQVLTVSPTGNSTSSKSSLSLQATAAHASTREFAVNFGLTSSVGEGVGTPGGDKVTVYAGAIANDGSGGIWAGNFLTRMNSGFSEAATGIEIDFDNVSGAHSGDASLAGSGTWGLQISGASTFRSHGAMLVSGSTTQWNRGVTFANDCIRLATFQDDCNAITVFDINGSHTTGLDFSGATISGAAIAFATGHKISWNSDDITITGTGNVLTFAGADSDYIFSTDEDAGTTKVRIHNTGDGNVTTKLAALGFYGTDTVAATKEVASIEAVPNDANWVGARLDVYTRAGDAKTIALRVGADQSVKAVSPTGGLGYGTGAGGTVTQATSKATGITLNTVCGQITLNGAALAANTTVSFTWTNSAIADGDVVVWTHESGGTIGAYTVNSDSAAGSATVNVRNMTGGSLSEAPVLGFAVVKATRA